MNPVVHVYLRVEAYLADIAGDDWPLRLDHRWPKCVRHHSLLDGVHLKEDKLEVTWKIQERGTGRGHVSHKCSTLKLKAYDSRERVQVNDWGDASRRERGIKHGRKGEERKKSKRWLMWTGGRVFSQQQLVPLSVAQFLGAVQML